MDLQDNSLPTKLQRPSFAPDIPVLKHLLFGFESPGGIICPYSRGDPMRP